MLQDRHARGVLEAHVVEFDGAADPGERRKPRVVGILGRHLTDLPDPVQPGKRFAQLRADVGELHDWQRHQAR